MQTIDLNKAAALLRSKGETNAAGLLERSLEAPQPKPEWKPTVGEIVWAKGVPGEVDDIDFAAPSSPFMVNNQWYPLSDLVKVPALGDWEANKVAPCNQYQPNIKQLVSETPQPDKSKLAMSWEGLPVIDGFWITPSGGSVRKEEAPEKPNNSKRATYPTKADAQSTLAMAQLLQLRKQWLSVEAPDWVPDWNDGWQEKACVTRWGNQVSTALETMQYAPFSFPPSTGLASRFLAAFPELLKTAHCL